MQRIFLKSKIHRAVVTEADLTYEGSLSLDRDLMIAADLMPFEQVKVYNVSNGERFDTYIIEAPAGSGTVCLNGAAARKGAVGDVIIIACYALFSEKDIENGKTIAVSVDAKNRILSRAEVKWQDSK
ncbi:MAG: aspartate 1-decarboxylase [Dissulfurimicrobium sp.]|uniref:aspartate 1-decarboxylase n=1 Tax=Dissulfurimicrobium TaxID=1769732 RepID=UPI001EDC4577|nr:aspartate 1-decarboxylase [Dissulfurimicrobium hydrothermale]UKL13146.1 aspartate 1-decarboxylase [Dissulfurimicrobium hydrothermale]